MSSKVYWTDFTVDEESRTDKLVRLIKKAGIEQIDFTKKYAAIKLHFGEPGNLAYLRPNYAKAVADTVKSLGGLPFLTDCNTLYVGRRKNALDHLEAAYENGFSPFSTGCHILIADGLKGTDETLVDIDGDYVKQAKIGAAVMDADILISLTHFKMHEGAGIGGCLKNIGMGCGSRAGKMEMHSSGKPRIGDGCVGCGRCVKNCAHGALALSDTKPRRAVINTDRCTGCGRCIGMCNFDAIHPGNDHSPEILSRKIAEYTWAVCKDKPCFHISMVMDVSPLCDCYAHNDAPVIADIGMFASFDPVALDKACADAVNRAAPLPGSLLDGKKSLGDHFREMHPGTDWLAGLQQGEKLGLGSMDYELIEL